MELRQTLKEQCASLGWPLRKLPAIRHAKQVWSFGDATGLHPEEVVALSLIAEGKQCCWCEGRSVSVLLKAAALPVLAQRNIFGDRVDAVRAALEGQLTVLASHSEEIFSCAAQISVQDLQSNISEICANTMVQEFYPNLRAPFVRLLAQVVSQELRVSLLRTFFIKPYEYRSGWPDLTVVDGACLSFVEVKTTDKFHESQFRFAREIAAHHGLECAVTQVVPVG